MQLGAPSDASFKRRLSSPGSADTYDAIDVRSRRYRLNQLINGELRAYFDN